MQNGHMQMNQGGGSYEMPSYYGMPNNYNNIAAASFYSHMPFGSSAYMGGFGPMSPLVPMQQYPMDMMAYGSHTMNFNTPTAKNLNMMN
jgi:hypothetical protein